ncbi:MAG: HD family phosphohydrolase [Vulcanimicrobiota bacterium]
MGEVSPVSVMADRTVEIPNERATEEARRRAASQVETVYIFDPTAVRLGEQKIQEAFDLIGRMARLKRAVKKGKLPAEYDEMAQALPISFSASQLDLLTSTDQDQLLILETTATHILFSVMETSITQESLPGVRAGLPEMAQDQLASLDEKYRQPVLAAVSDSLYPNRNPDYEATKRAEQEAMASVKPITTIIPKGFAVVREGDLVSPRQISALEALGVSKPKLNVQRLVGYALLVGSLMLLVVGFLRRERPEFYSSRRHLVLLGVIVVSTAIICRMLVGLSIYLAPVAIASILATILLEARLGLLVTGFLAIYVGVMAQSLPACGASFITGAAGVLALSKVTSRSRLIYASILVGLANLAAVVAFELVDSVGFTDSLNNVGFGLLNGFLSAWLAVGALPMFEHFSGITTHLKLLDLSNLNEPLLQRLTREAPGTYQHSMMVANLAEQCAREIGADAMLCRVGAYYHDIGKMKRPRFFIENQTGLENPHDRLAPSLSTKIILSHVKDGLEMGRQANLPDTLLDFIAQHHGTSLVSYFYHQARSRSSEPVYEDDFRYPGPKPQTRETAILLLCDGLEAAARTLSHPTPEKISELVHKMIKNHLDDGQLDECDLSLKDLQLIRQSLIRSLQGIYHTRIEYPEASSLSGRKKVTQLRRKV